MNTEEEFFDSHEEEKKYKWEDLLKISDSHINHQNIKIISVSDCKELIEYIHEYSFNSPLNRSHIGNLKNDISKNNIIPMTLSLIHEKNDTLVLLDGHHRKSAIKELYDEGFNKNIPLIIHLYDIDSRNSDEAFELFRKLNNIKPFKTKIDMVKICSEIIQDLSGYYPNLFKEANREKGINRPHIHKNKFNDHLHKLLLENEDEYSIDKNQIVRKIIEYNNSLKSVSAHKKKKYKITDKMYEKLLKIDCFLSIVNYEEWLSDMIRSS